MTANGIGLVAKTVLAIPAKAPNPVCFAIDPCFRRGDIVAVSAT